VLSLLGGAMGLGLAWARTRADRCVSSGLPRVADIAIDPAVLVFTLLVSVGTGVAFGLAPLLLSPGVLAVSERACDARRVEFPPRCAPSASRR
jgi:hypothetical protein